MSAWLVSRVPPPLLLLGLIVLVAGGAVLIQMYVRRRYPALRHDDHNDATKFTYGVISLVYAFFIGFLVSAMWGQVNAASVKALAEGAAAVQLARDATVFAVDDEQRIRQSLLDYERAAIAEWSDVEGGRRREVDAALDGVYSAYGQVRVGTEAQKALLATSFGNLDKISQARTERILQAREDNGPPWPLWVVIFLTSAMVLGTAIVYGVERPSLHYPMVAVVGVLVAANLFLILQLSHPFLGGLATSSVPLQEAVSVLDRSS
ncbi:bestrophin-like domain [Mycolicibacterium palauense]|uniref:bestrophin-like domain n=1 Tax=Mycolicibacterium palauense TaxID=2034511 RepID=UPI001FEBA1E6|nr:DUF4239 domain-containing protein [Mycolicibacterium palauense]